MEFYDVPRKKAFVFTETEKRTNTFMGGKPYINDSFVFPHNKEGDPLHFLLQIDLSEVDNDVKKSLSLPITGYLQFYTGNNEFFGMDLKDLGNFMDDTSHIMYLENAYDHTDMDLPYDHNKTTTPLAKPYTRVYYKGTVLEMLPYPKTIDAPEPSYDDTEWGDLDDEDAYLKFYENANENYYEFYLGGYPHFAQEDFREKNTEWRLLLGFESDENIMWGDAGTAGYWLKENDMNNQAYNKARLYWDCA